MNVQAIETWYRGHKFRSRLEARWAVFFETLGIHWQYEVEGYHLKWRLKTGVGDSCLPTFKYLPDFWLPDHALWVEVKGALAWPSADRLLNAGAALSLGAADWGCRIDLGRRGSSNGGNDLLVLGPIPDLRQAEYHLPARLHMCQGALKARPTSLLEDYVFPCNGVTLAQDSGSGEPDNYDLAPGQFPCDHPRGDRQEFVIDVMMGGFLWDEAIVDLNESRRLIRAYAAARSARFEHGQSGSMLVTEQVSA